MDALIRHRSDRIRGGHSKPPRHFFKPRRRGARPPSALGPKSGALAVTLSVDGLESKPPSVFHYQRRLK